MDDPELQHIIDYIDMMFAGLGAEEPLSVLPWLKFLPDSDRIKKLKEGVRLRDEHTKREFDEHRRTLDPNNIRDITDNLLHLSQDEEVWGMIHMWMYVDYFYSKLHLETQNSFELLIRIFIIEILYLSADSHNLVSKEGHQYRCWLYCS